MEIYKLRLAQKLILLNKALTGLTDAVISNDRDVPDFQAPDLSPTEGYTDDIEGFNEIIAVQNQKLVSALAQGFNKKNADIRSGKAEMAQLQAEVERLETEGEAAKNSHAREYAQMQEELFRMGDWALRLKAELEEAQNQVAEMRSSFSWRITFPLRELGAWVLRPGQQFRRYAVFALKFLKTLYYALPFSERTRFKHLQWAAKISPRILLATGTQPAYLQSVINSSTSIRKKPAQRTPSKVRSEAVDYVVWGVIDWHFRNQRPQHLARELAKLGRRVFYVSPHFVPTPEPGFETEVLDEELPLYQVKFHLKDSPAIYFNAPGKEEVWQLRCGIGQLLEQMGSLQTVSLVNHPYWTDIARVLPNSRLVYDCMDHHAGFGTYSDGLHALENALLSMSDMTVVTSSWLEKELTSICAQSALVRNATDYGFFSTKPAKVYRDAKKRRVIGYYGAIAEWFDVPLVAALAGRFPTCSILLIGHDTVGAQEQLKEYPNVAFTGEVPYRELPFYLYGFDVCLLPFRVIPLTLATNPVKVYEYLSAGKPVVAVDLPEISQFDGLVYAAEGTEAFLGQVALALSEGQTAALVQRRQQFAASQTWTVRAKALSGHAEAWASDPWISVIIVTYNNLSFTKDCLDSLDQYSQYPNLEIIVVDNHSSDDTPSYLERWATSGKNRRIIPNDENRGFAAANNQGLALACGDYLVLLNNDTYVTPGWVRTLMNHLRRDPSIGIIGPVTNNIGNESRIEIAYESLEEMLDKSRAYTRAHLGHVFDLPTTAFFCVMFSRATYEAIGPLDEVFGQGFFEDDDYCRRIEQLGLRISCADDVFVHHHLSASFDKLKAEARKALFERNRVLYEAKWGAWKPHVYRDAL